MNDTMVLAALALFILLFGMVSKRIEKTIITAPMLFVFFGALLSDRFLGVFHADLESPIVHLIAEFALVLVLFSDAARIDVRLLFRQHTIPVRLLSIGLPLTIGAGVLASSILLKQLTIWEGLVLAAILAPTDAALGQAVVSNPKVPVRIRQSLNAESGLNDGFALPIVLIALCIASVSDHGETAGFWLRFSLLQVTLGPLVGIAVGYLGGRMVVLGSRTQWMSHTFQDLSALGLAFLSFALAELVGGNGFIAAFCAGMTLGNTSRDVCECLYEFAEAEGQLLVLGVFAIFGAVIAPTIHHDLSGTTILYAVLSLTVIRMVPVALSLLGTGLNKHTILFIGWFGPRGIATILFGLVVLEDMGLAGRHDIFSIASVTVLLSILLHGVSAVPWSNLYARSVEQMKQSGAMPEHESVDQMPTRADWEKESGH